MPRIETHARQTAFLVAALSIASLATGQFGYVFQARELFAQNLTNPGRSNGALGSWSDSYTVVDPTFFSSATAQQTSNIAASAISADMTTSASGGSMGRGTSSRSRIEVGFNITATTFVSLVGDWSTQANSFVPPGSSWRGAVELKIAGPGVSYVTGGSDEFMNQAVSFNRTFMLVPGLYSLTGFVEQGAQGAQAQGVRSTLDFSLTVIPAPGVLGLAAGGLLILSRRRRYP